MFFHPDLTTQLMWYRLSQRSGNDDEEGGEEDDDSQVDD